MILGIDIGGTKTLLSVFSAEGELLESHRFETPQDYRGFIETFGRELNQLKERQFTSAVAAVPGRLDREAGVALAFGSLDWENVPIRDDLSRFLTCPLRIENDTKLAGLSEARLLTHEFSHVLYVTISTGISSVLVIDGIIDPGAIDSETGQMLFQHDGKLIDWEDFASGRAFYEKFGQKLADISDPKALAYIAEQLAPGLINLIANYTPDIIVLGGGVGAHLDKYKSQLDAEIKKFDNPMVPIPPIRQAQRPEEAVIYGCYELAAHADGPA